MSKFAVILSMLFSVSAFAAVDGGLKYRAHGGLSFIEAWTHFSSKEMFNSKKAAVANIRAYIASLESQVGPAQKAGTYCSQTRVQESLSGLEKLTSTKGDLVLYWVGNTRIVHGYIALLEAKAENRAELMTTAQAYCNGLND